MGLVPNPISSRVSECYGLNRESDRSHIEQHLRLTEIAECQGYQP